MKAKKVKLIKVGNSKYALGQVVTYNNREMTIQNIRTDGRGQALYDLVVYSGLKPLYRELDVKESLIFDEEEAK